MRALFLLLASLTFSGAHALNINQIIMPPAGTPGKVKLIVTPGEITNLGKLDLMIVVDDSGSMADHQTILSRNVPALAAKLAQFSSLQVGVTTSSMDDRSRPGAKGKFLGTPAVLTNALPNFKDLLAARLKVGINGSAEEMFFAPIIAALTPPLSNTINAGFLRPDAHLGVVIVTDTDDQSPGITPEEMIIQLATLKERAYSLITFFADPKDSRCSSQMPGKMPERLQLANYMAQGSMFNICEGKFAEGISDVANKVERELTRKIPLPMKPDITTLTVVYGALTFPAGDAQNGWTYEEPTNTLILGEKVDFNTLPAADLVISFTVK